MHSPRSMDPTLPAVQRPPLSAAPLPTVPLRKAEPPLKLLAASPELATAAAWKRDPWKLFFPLGLLLAWAGVLPWLLVGLGVGAAYLPAYHALVQVQGFLICFALGFLFTFLPRRTGTAPPETWELLVCLAGPALLAVCAILGAWLLAQVCWLVTLGTLARFALRRARTARAKNQLPPAFLWVAMGLVWGVLGSLCIAAGPWLPARLSFLFEVGRTLVLQGVFTGMVLGTGAFLVPAIARGTDPSRVAEGAPYRSALLRHAAGCALWTAAAFVEPLFDVRLGFALRGLVALAVVAGTMQLWRLPSMPGLHRWLVWVATWLLPAGSLVVAAAPGLRLLGLHVTFLGCFALLVLSVGAHVSLSHGGRPSLLSTSPWQHVAVTALLVLALFSRGILDVAPSQVWFALAAGGFLAATLAWATLALLPQKRKGTAP